MQWFLQSPISINWANTQAGKRFMEERGLSFSPGHEFVCYKDKKYSFVLLDSKLYTRIAFADKKFIQSISPSGELEYVLDQESALAVDNILKEVGLKD